MTSKELITQLYVGYFDRAPDPEGLAFWIDVLDGGFPLESIAIGFSIQPEAQDTYAYLDALVPPGPATGGDDIEAFITAIYDNLFDRAPDAAGLAFWKGVLEGGFEPGKFILAIIEGASPADEAILANKVEVACTWAEQAADEDGFVLTDAYITASRDALGDVSGDPETVIAGKAQADLFFQDGPAVALTGTITSLPEDTDLTARLKVADIVVTDDGIGTNVLALTGADADLFEIDGTELFLKAGTVLDFETVTMLDVTVTVDDAGFGGSPDDTAALSISITDANDAPTVVLSGTVTALDEDTDTSAAIKVADIVVSDDALGTNDLSLSGADADLFEIVGTELFLKAGTVLDFDSNGTLDVTVEVDDAGVGGSPDDSAALSIAVGDVNEAPSVALINEVAILSEDLDTTNRIKVADIVVTDDAPGTNVLSLSGDDADLFEIDGDALYLKAGAVLDFETNGSLDVTVAVDDADVGGSPDDTADLAITVTNVNEAPGVALSGQITDLAEDADTSAAIKVADIVLTDDGTGSNTLSLAGDDAGLFEIVGTELFLKAGSALDFETNPVLDVTVTVNDAAIGTDPDDSAALSIAVTDVNEAPSVALANTTSVLVETDDTSSRIKVADIVLSDDGLGTNVLSLSGADAGLFEIDGTELFLKAGTDLDFEVNPMLDVTVEVEDDAVGASPDDSASLSITVTDDNEPPTLAVINVPASLPEDTDTTTRVKVGDIVVTDDIAGTNILSLGGTDAALFEIDGTELYLKAGTGLDFESQTALDVTVLVDDTQLGTGAEDSVALTIGVTDVNEAPSVALENAVTTLSEDTDTSARIKMADIVVTDDAIGTNTLGLTGADADLFEIDGTELYLKAGTVLDFETAAMLDVSVVVDDAGIGAGVEDSAALPVTITDVNEPPTIALIGADTSIFEGANTTSAIVVATIQVTDDGTGTNDLALTGADAGLFEIVGNSLRLKAGTALDAVANPALDVTVTVDDPAIGAGIEDSAALSITVNPGAPGLAADDTEVLTFVGNASSTVRAGQIEVPDADSVTPGNQPGFVLNTDPNGTPYAGVASTALSLIDVTGLDGLLSLGVIAQVDSEDFTLDNSGSAGDVEACLGEGNVFGVLTTPSLSATGTWVFDNAGATGDMEIEIKAIDVAAGGTLDFNNVDICISGDVDLTAAVLDIDAASTIEVKAGAKLTLTVEQVTMLDNMVPAVFIRGEGEVCVIGESDDNDPLADTDFSNLRTATVDLSAVTLAATDSNDALDISVGGAENSTGGDLVDGAGDRIAQTVIGSANDDIATVLATANDTLTDNVDVILQLGADGGDIGVPGETPSGNTPTDATPEVAGDIIVLNNAAAGVGVQIEVDAGYDQVQGSGGLDANDTVTVAAGAEFYAPVSGDLTLTADSSNDGIAVLEADGDADATIDVSAAGGANGWTLIGADDADTGSETTLVGSDQDDVLTDGSADDDDNDGDEDVFTGGAGADTFTFNIGQSTPADFEATTTTAALDYEYIQVAPAGAVVETGTTGQLTIVYTLNGNTTSVNVNDSTVTGGVDFTDASSIAAGILEVMDGIAGIDAVAEPTGTDVVRLLALPSAMLDGNGGGLVINSIVPTGFTTAPTVTTVAFDAGGAGNGPDDQAQITDVVLTLPGGATAPTPGETYTITITRADGTDVTASYTAGAADDLDDVANGLLTNADMTGLNDLLAGEYSAANTTGGGGANDPQTITITDLVPQNGGFSADGDAAAGIVAVSSSSILPAVATGATLADQDVDLITDFTDADDLIDFVALDDLGVDQLVAGTGSNYDEDANVADFEAALTAANAAFAGDPDLVYYLTGSDDAADNDAAVGINGSVGLLFVNANGDDVADAVIALQGVNASNFDDSNIV